MIMCKRHRTRRPSTVGQKHEVPAVQQDVQLGIPKRNPHGVVCCIRFAKKISHRGQDKLGNIIRLMREMGLEWWASYKAARKLHRMSRGSSDPMVRARKAESAVFRMAWGLESSRRRIYSIGRSAISRAEDILWRPRDNLSKRFASSVIDTLDDEIFGNLENGLGQAAYVKYVARGIETVVNSSVGSLVQSIHAGGSAFVTGMCPCGSHSLSYVHCYRYWGLRCQRICDQARDMVAGELIGTDEGWKCLLFEAREVLDHSGMLIDGLNAAVFHGVLSALLPFWAKILISAGKSVAYIITGDRFLGPPSSRPKLGETDLLVRTAAICALYITACRGEATAKGYVVGYMLAIAIGNGRGVEQVGDALDRLWLSLVDVASGRKAGGRVCWPL